MTTVHIQAFSMHTQCKLLLSVPHDFRWNNYEARTDIILKATYNPVGLTTEDFMFYYNLQAGTFLNNPVPRWLSPAERVICNH